MQIYWWLITFFIFFINGCASLTENSLEGFTFERSLRDESKQLTSNIVDAEEEFEASQVNEEDFLISEGFCKDDIYTSYLKNQYLKASQLPKFKFKSDLDAWKRKQEIRSLHHATGKLTQKTSSYFGAIPVVVTEDVEMWIRYFKTTGRQSFIKWLVRGESIKGILRPLLREAGMPVEFFYLSMIESGFNNAASSRAKATGPWQFVSSTAKMYGLKINYWYDERRDPIKSTIAAANYLRDLYIEFGDWYLAMAAYNAGPGKIKWAIRKANSRDFWVLSKTKWIRKETRNYVPKVLAALILGADPEKYGFVIEANPTDQLPGGRVFVKQSVKLDELAIRLGISSQTLKKWNPELVQNITPPPRWNESNGYSLRLPDSYIDKFEEIKNTLSYVEVKDIHMHKINPGETLSSISRQYKVSVQKILQFNPKVAPHRLRVGKLLAVPVPSIVEKSFGKPTA